MLRTTIFLATLLFPLTLPGLAQQSHPFAASSEHGQDLPTYYSQRGTSPAACEAKCAEDPNCAGWTLSLPTFRMGPRCELKQAAGSRPALSAPSPRRVETPLPAPMKEPVNISQSAKTPPVAAAPPQPEPVEPKRPIPAPPRRSEPTAPTQPANVQPRTKPPAPPPLIARPSVVEAPLARREAASIPAPAPTPIPEQDKPPLPSLGGRVDLAPLPALGQDDRPPLPRRRLNEGAGYSVQNLEQLPGDREATAGFIDSVSEENGPAKPAPAASED